MKTVLAPIDFSPVTARVIEHAVELAEAVQGRLVLLSVIPPRRIAVGEFSAPDVADEITREDENAAAAHLVRLQQELRANGHVAHAVHDSGEIVVRILAQAERLEADYIVMGSHGHRAFYDLLIGSTTKAVLERAQCRVVIVPVNAADAAAKIVTNANTSGIA